MKNHKIQVVVISVICVLAIVFIIFSSRNRKPRNELLTNRILSESDLSASLDFSVSFIAREYGRKKFFETFLCNKDISDCGENTVFSLFMSTAILNIIQDIERDDLGDIVKHETVRTRSCQNEHFMWDFYCMIKGKDVHYYPDLDTTSLASWFLSSRKIEHHLEELREQVRKTQFHKGALLTFLRDFQPPPHAMNQDPVVNANALVLLSEEIPSVCGFINKNYEKSIYYTDDVVVFYMLAKAYSRGVKCIEPALEGLYKKIRSSDLLKKNDAPMHISMFVTALTKWNSGNDEMLDAAIKSLLENEWEFPFEEPFFRTGLNMKRDFYYSPAFSAAVYAEALTNIKSYQAMKQGKKQ